MRVRRHRQQAGLTEQPAPRVERTVQRDVTEVVAVDVRDVVVLGQPLVDEGLVRRQQLEHAVDLASLAVEKQLHLTGHRLAQVRVEVGEGVGVGRHQRHVAEIEPLSAEVVDKRPGAGVGEHPRDLRLQHPLATQLVPLGQTEQRIVGQAAPQEERQPGGELRIADRVDRILRRPAGEDGPPPGRIAASGDVVGPTQLDPADTGVDRLVAGVLVARDGVVRPTHAFEHRRLVEVVLI